MKNGVSLSLTRSGKDKAILFFQHFGWEYLSLGEPDGAGGSLWWSTNNINLLGDVICDRNAKVDNNSACDDPYNVIGIFSGHLHGWSYNHPICVIGEYHPDDKAANRHWKECRQTLDIVNYTVDDGGHEDNAGYYMVRLQIDKTKDGSATLAEGTMTVNKVAISFGDDYSNDSGDCNNYQHFTKTVNGGGWPKIKKFTTEIQFFQQGEPNNAGGVEHCAEVNPNGRANDVKCSLEKRVACKNGQEWALSSDWHYTWQESFANCREMGVGWEFTVPKTIEDQKAIIELMDDTHSHNVWVNNTDKGRHGQWIEAPWFYEFFPDNEPNHGSDDFEQGWGQNCGMIMPDTQLLHDQYCEMKLDYCLCKTSAGWRVAATQSRLGETWSGCFSECGEGESFEFPEDLDDFHKLQQAVRDWGLDEQIWIGISDLDEEGQWVTGQPWIMTDAPFWIDGGDNQNCAQLNTDGHWHDNDCEQTDRSLPFACRNYKNGEWIISSMESDAWVDGFEACRNEGLRYYFACPIREMDNHIVNALVADEGTVWLNSTDAHEEGKWRHGYWENWNDGEPNNSRGNEDCAAILWGGKWNDSNCGNLNPALCRYDNDLEPGQWDIMYGHFVSWSDAASWCSQYDGWKFSYPTCPSELEDVKTQISGTHSIWIQYNDIHSEGYFSPWH